MTTPNLLDYAVTSSDFFLLTGSAPEEIAIPFAGEIIELIYLSRAALTTADAVVTFTIDGVASSDTVTILLANHGSIDDAASYPVNHIPVAKGSSCVLTSDGGPDTGTGPFTLVIRR